MKYFMFFLAGCLWMSFGIPAQAQYASQKEAAYMATLKAVTDYKMNAYPVWVDYLPNSKLVLWISCGEEGAW